MKYECCGLDNLSRLQDLTEKSSPLYSTRVSIFPSKRSHVVYNSDEVSRDTWDYRKLKRDEYQVIPLVFKLTVIAVFRMAFQKWLIILFCCCLFTMTMGKLGVLRSRRKSTGNS